MKNSRLLLNIYLMHLLSRTRAHVRTNTHTQYNSLFNIQFTHHTKVIAFADDLVIMTTVESIPEAENIMNVGLSKISDWGKRKQTPVQ